MSLSDIATVREWVGSTPSDSDLIATIGLHDGNPQRAALAILRVRRADLTAAAMQFAVAGDYSQDTTANLKALDALIGRLERELGVDDDGLAVLTSTPICGPRLGR